MAVTQVKAASHKSQSRPQPKKKNQKTQANPGPASFPLIERKLPHRKFVEFTEMKGRTVEKIELFTTGEYHSISINFQDRTALHLRIDPAFVLNADFSDTRTGDVEVIHEWPPIHSSTSRH